MCADMVTAKKAGAPHPQRLTSPRLDERRLQRVAQAAEEEDCATRDACARPYRHRSPMLAP